MNEITKIHLGRLPFTISVDAHHSLKLYLTAIAKRVKDTDVQEEIEMRIAELLTERGFGSEKVVLLVDIDYIKQQLGSPEEFSEDADELSDTELLSTDKRTRRLFRDTEQAYVAGVAAGLAQYFGIDVILMRILFVVFTFMTAGWGVALYIILWLLVPEAKTPSDRLQMMGRPVTMQNLKALVEQTDIKGAAQRANTAMSGPVNALFRLILKLAGIWFVAVGITAIMGIITFVTYYLTHTVTWNANNIFPRGWQENLLFDIGIGIAILLAVFVIIIGIALFRRHWPLKSWVTGTLIGLILVGFASGGVMTVAVLPTVQAAYQANRHETSRALTSFNSLNIQGAYNSIDIVPYSSSMITFRYYDHPDLRTISTTVTQHTLTIDTSHFNWQRSCSTLCFPHSYMLDITIYSPNAAQLQTNVMPPPFMHDVPWMPYQHAPMFSQ